ncbi:tetratricopeptide repeat protein [Flavobacteriales bacterium]|nr:tetratricopeptide repeat protein [Flavobacteriales bacterium]
MKPEYSFAYNLRGVSKAKVNDLEGAIKDHNKAIEIKSDYADAYYFRANSKKKLGIPFVSDYTKAIELKPDYLDAYLNRANSKKTLGNPFCSDYKKACELGDPQSCDCHNADCI